MPNPVLTNISDADKKALRSGLCYTLVEFSYDPENPGNTIITLVYQANTKNLCSQPESLRPLTLNERKALNKLHWGIESISTTIPILGEFETPLQAFADQYIQILSDAGRTTPLTSSSLYFWLYMLWPSVRTHIVAAAQRSQFGWAGSPYKMAFWCPQGPPTPLEVKYELPKKPETKPSYRVVLGSYTPGQYRGMDSPPSYSNPIPLQVIRENGHTAKIQTTLTITHTGPDFGYGGSGSYTPYGSGGSSLNSSVYWTTNESFTLMDGSKSTDYTMNSGEQGSVADLPPEFTLTPFLYNLPLSSVDNPVMVTGWLHCDDGEVEQDIEIKLIVPGYLVDVVATPFFNQPEASEGLAIDASGTLVFVKTGQPVNSINIEINYKKDMPSSAYTRIDFVTGYYAWVGDKVRLKEYSNYLEYNDWFISFTSTDSTQLTVEIDPTNWPGVYGGNGSLNLYLSIYMCEMSLTRIIQLV